MSGGSGNYADGGDHQSRQQEIAATARAQSRARQPIDIL
jgi:hypothetical protein